MIAVINGADIDSGTSWEIGFAYSKGIKIYGILEDTRKLSTNLLNPMIKGIMNVSNFSGKNVMMFVVVGTTEDEHTVSTLEGDLEWIPFDKLDKINVFDDVKPFLETITKLKPEEMFLGKAKFDGKFKLLELNYSVY